MSINRIRRLTEDWDGHELPAADTIPAGFVVIPLAQLPPAMQQAVGGCGELYRIAFEQARAAAEAAEFGPDGLAS